MMAEHLFLSCSPAPPPQRWHEAFPAGRLIEAPALADHLRAPATVPAVVWLGAANRHWVQQLRDIRRARAGTSVVLLSNDPDPVEGLAALNEGARGYTHAFATPRLLKEVAVVVEHGGLWVGPDLLQRLVGSTSSALAADPQAIDRLRASTASGASSGAGPGPGPRPRADAWAMLSNREAEVARAVMAGRSNKEVAALMKISERTVKAHLGTVFERLGVRDRLQLVLCLSQASAPQAMPAKQAA